MRKYESLTNHINISNALALFILLILSSCASLPDYYLSTDRQKLLSREEMLKDIEDERVIFVGEGHSSARDHLVQLDIIKYLQEKGKRPTVALEVFSADRQSILDGWIGGALDFISFEEECYRIWDMLYWYYGKIFEFVREQGIPLVGINADRPTILNVAMNGMDAIPETRRKEIGVRGCEEDSQYKESMSLALVSGIHDKPLPFLCDAQRLSDATMAYNIGRLLETKHGAVIVLTGAAHASKSAVPRLLAGMRNIKGKVLLPDNFRDFMGREIDSGLADFIWR
ncbi:MAG: ChaN family lipoprotein [Nitrospirae bacterium]|nr:ChaN family lipoprotein [Nitrospirota bacterium]